MTWLHVNTDDATAFDAMIEVQARGPDVVISIGESSAVLSPQQAQRFAYYLARAYARAGQIKRNHQGNFVIGGAR